MCYYARIDYDCRDWRWGNMMLRCPRQHRIGETCGAKLVHSESVTKGGPLCKVCEEMETKKRRLTKTCDNIQRWSREPDKFSASLEKAKREAGELTDKINELQLRRPSVATNMGGGTHTPSVSTNTLPPLSMMTASPSPGYEYVSSQTTSHRRQEPTGPSVPRSGGMAPASMTNGVSIGHVPATMQYQPTQTSTYSRNSMMPGTPQGNMANNRYHVTYSVHGR